MLVRLVALVGNAPIVIICIRTKLNLANNRHKCHPVAAPSTILTGDQPMSYYSGSAPRRRLRTRTLSKRECAAVYRDVDGAWSQTPNASDNDSDEF